VFVGRGVHFVERPPHHPVKSLIDLFFGPEEAFPVLHPFEVGRRYAPCVGQNVRNYEYLLLGEHLVGLRMGRPIRPLCNDSGFKVLGDLAVNLVLLGRRNEHVGVERKEFLVCDGLCLFVARQRAPVLLYVCLHLFEVEASLVVVAARHVTDGHHCAALLREQSGRGRSHIPEALHGHRAVARGKAELLHRGERNRHHATARGFSTALRSS